MLIRQKEKAGRGLASESSGQSRYVSDRETGGQQEGLGSEAAGAGAAARGLCRRQSLDRGRRPAQGQLHKATKVVKARIRPGF